MPVRDNEFVEVREPVFRRAFRYLMQQMLQACRDLERTDRNQQVQIDFLLAAPSGSIVDVDRVTNDITLDATYHNVFCNTNDNPITVQLPAGIGGTEYRIINTGNNFNDVTLTPDDSDFLLGINSSLTLPDGNVLVIAYEDIEGWW